MCVEKHMKIIIQRAFLHLKQISVLAAVPFIFINAVLPVICVGVYIKYREENLSLAIQKIGENMMLFIPLFSPWLSIFAAKEYLEGEGNELLFIKQKNKYSDLLIPFLLSFVNSIAFVLVISSIFPSLRLLSLWILIICVFMFNLSYLMMFAFSSVTAAIMVHLLYFVANLSLSAKINIFPIYFASMGYDFSSEFKTVYLPMIIATVICFITGSLCNIRKSKYQ